MCVCVATRCRFVVLWTSSIFIFAGCARVTAAGAVEVCEGARGFEGELRVLTGRAKRKFCSRKFTLNSGSTFDRDAFQLTGHSYGISPVRFYSSRNRTPPRAVVAPAAQTKARTGTTAVAVHAPRGLHPPSSTSHTARNVRDLRRARGDVRVASRDSRLLPKGWRLYYEYGQRVRNIYG